MKNILKQYSKGKSLTLGELKSMPKENAIVYATYKKNGNLRLNQAVFISRFEDGSNNWTIYDDNSGCGYGDFSPDDEHEDDEQCYEDVSGEFFLWYAVPKKS